MHPSFAGTIPHCPKCGKELAIVAQRITGFPDMHVEHSAFAYCPRCPTVPSFETHMGGGAQTLVHDRDVTPTVLA